MQMISGRKKRQAPVRRGPELYGRETEELFRLRIMDMQKLVRLFLWKLFIERL